MNPGPRRTEGTEPHVLLWPHTDDPVAPPTLCEQCQTHFAALEEVEDDIPAAPNPYEHGLKTLRAATATPLSTFEDRWKADRLREVTATRTALDAEVASVPRMTAAEKAELAAFTPPNPYEAGIKALRAKETRWRCSPSSRSRGSRTKGSLLPDIASKADALEAVCIDGVVAPSSRWVNQERNVVDDEGILRAHGEPWHHVPKCSGVYIASSWEGTRRQVTANGKNSRRRGRWSRRMEKWSRRMEEWSPHMNRWSQRMERNQRPGDGWTRRRNAGLYFVVAFVPRRSEPRRTAGSRATW